MKAAVYEDIEKISIKDIAIPKTPEGGMLVLGNFLFIKIISLVYILKIRFSKYLSIRYIYMRYKIKK